MLFCCSLEKLTTASDDDDDEEEEEEENQANDKRSYSAQCAHIFKTHKLVFKDSQEVRQKKQDIQTHRQKQREAWTNIQTYISQVYLYSDNSNFLMPVGC